MARVFKGKVVSIKMDKTAVVEVTRFKDHPIYRKKFKVTKRYLAHDTDNSCVEGQMVEISETRPLSRHKRWIVRGDKV